MLMCCLVVVREQAVLWLILAALGAYMSVVFVLLLISVYSTTYAECVKGIRKMFSIMMSMFAMGKDKSFGMMHWCGIGFFMASSAITIYSKSTKSKNKETKKGAKSKKKKQ